MLWHRPFLLACALLAPVALFAEPAATNGNPGEKSPADQKPTAKATSNADKENAVLVGIPAGQTFHGVHIPNYSPSGKLLMLFDAESARRIADRDIEMQDLKIEIHNDDGSTFHVAMSHSVFNLDTRILTSDTPTTIQRDDFIINGDKAQFHVKERFGKVMGNVKMIITPDSPKKSDDKTK